MFTTNKTVYAMKLHDSGPPLAFSWRNAFPRLIDRYKIKLQFVGQFSRSNSGMPSYGKPATTFSPHNSPTVCVLQGDAVYAADCFPGDAVGLRRTQQLRDQVLLA